MSWIEGPLVGFDTETTGVDTAHDRIVTAALVHRSAGRTRVRTWLIDPGVEIPAGATAIHGITTEHARAHGRDPVDALDEIAAELVTASAAGAPVVAFNAGFDLSILDAELRRHGLRTTAERLGRPVAPVVDPLVLDRVLVRFRRGKRTLTDLCQAYGVVGDGLHTADVDVVATLDVLAAQAAQFAELAGMDVSDLHDYQARGHRAWAESYNAWRQSQGLPGPGAETVWLGRG